MIIECPSCRTRFRLDESRIKGRGARVRCRRCGDSIMVLKPKETEGPEAVGGTFDLRTVVKESIGERPAAARPAEISGPRPSAGAPQGNENLLSSAKDEIDLAFEKILESSREEVTERPAEVSDFRPEEKVDVLPAGEIDKKEIPLESASADFLLSDTDTLDQLKKEFREESAGETKKPLDISGSLRPDVEIPLSSPEDLQTPIPPPVPLVEEEPVAMPPQDFEAQLREVSAAEPEPAPPPPPPPEPPPAKEPVHPRPPERREAPSSRFRPSLAVLVVLFLVLAVGGAYLGFTKSGQNLLRGMFPGMESLWLGGGKSGPQFDVRNLIGYYEPNSEEGSLFIIKGHVINVGRTRKSGIRIHAALLNEKDQAIRETSCYAGNVLQGDMLRTARRNDIEKLLANRFGERLTNMDVQPGKSVPFMVVFFDAPEEISAYRLEALEGD